MSVWQIAGFTDRFTKNNISVAGKVKKAGAFRASAYIYYVYMAGIYTLTDIRKLGK